MRYFLAIYTLVILSLVACKHRDQTIVSNDVIQAQKLIGIEFSREKIDTLSTYLNTNLAGYDSLRQFSIDAEIFPALLFNPLPAQFKMPTGPEFLQIETIHNLEIPENLDSLCFYSIGKLAHLLQSRKITSVQLTNLYLDRIDKYDGVLKTVITLTEDLARQEAQKADEEMDQGIFRSLLHGIPYGLKDLIAVEGYPTTWGAEPYRTQTINHTATVATTLREAGAVLIAKLSSGALARGDVWYDGQTMSPWDTLLGASGSSAGSGSATAAGLVAFALGTETLGSITSPSARNGVTGLRPTYGTVSRYGVMSLAWSMDKVGPICRSAEDCAIVFSVIHGRDSLDASSFSTPFSFDASRKMTDMRVGILREDIAIDTSAGAANLKRMLSILDSLQIEPIEKRLPDNFPFKVFDIILRSESGAFFDELVRSGAVDKMVQQDKRSRANSLRQSRFIPAVEYLQANRHRALLIEEMHELMEDIDVLVSPASAKNQLLITNLTGHPALSIPTGLDSLNHPTSLTLIGQLFGEGKLVEFAHALQKATNYHEMLPPLFEPQRYSDVN